ncbi:MAG: YdcF family protein [Planctomycetota bacterium]
MRRTESGSGQDIRATRGGAVVWFGALGRGLALFLGGFSLLNILGEWRFPGFDANHWWIDFRPMEPLAAQLFLAVSSLLLIAYSIRPKMSNRRRALTFGFSGALVVVTIWNVVRFYVLVGRGVITAGFPVAFSLLVSMALVIVLMGLALWMPKSRVNTGTTSKIIFAVTSAVCLVGFPLAQMFCFGKTDYRRRADAIVVFGARVYADGRCSDALADRVRTGCRLYLDGLAKRLILSGGPGDGEIHETEAMRRMALKLGVPDEAIILDKEGVNTQATVGNTCMMFERLGVKRVLAASHFYHLPRIKMTYQRRHWEVYTVPARESYILTEMPKYVLREVAALWVYYLRPIVP